MRFSSSRRAWGERGVIRRVIRRVSYEVSRGQSIGRALQYTSSMQRAAATSPFEATTLHYLTTCRAPPTHHHTHLDLGAALEVGQVDAAQDAVLLRRPHTAAALALAGGRGGGGRPSARQSRGPPRPCSRPCPRQVDGQRLAAGGALGLPHSSLDVLDEAGAAEGVSVRRGEGKSQTGVSAYRMRRGSIGGGPA